LVVIGFGQCGGKIADEFARLNSRAHRQRRVEIITSTYAVDTDAIDLSELHTIKADYQQRILVGAEKTRGHGVAGLSELGAEIAREYVDKVIDTIRSAERFYEADAFLLVASAAGGTGSGAIPIMTQHMKASYVDKSVYSLIVLPFDNEEMAEETTVYNTAICLKSVSSVADAVFLFDNQRYAAKDFSLRSDMNRINQLIVEPFYDLLCAGEERKAKHIGVRMLDAGDIIQTLSGWTAIGYGKSPLPSIKLPFQRKHDFRKKSTETDKGIEAMDGAIGGLSIQCNAADSTRALYLLSAPAKEMKVELANEIGDYLQRIVPDAIVSHGDYPVDIHAIHVVLVLSQLINVEKVRDYYARSVTFLQQHD